MLQENTIQKRSKAPTKQNPILHEVEIIYNGPKASESIKITSSRDALNILRETFDKNKICYKEMFYVLLLNHGNYCLGISKIGEGSTKAVVVNVKEIFQLALKTNASGIILSHNHPSGSTKPSSPDIKLTENVKMFAEALEMKLLDHIIITSESYLSMADEGMI